MLKSAIVGLGVVSGSHINALKETEDAILTAVCDIDSSKKDIVPGVPFYTDVDAMLDTENIDVLHVCLPHYLHVPVTLSAARRGINVFLEKPPALNSSEIKLLYNLPVKLGICFQNRYNNTSVEILSAVKNGEFGKVLGVKGIVTWHRDESYYKDGPWRGIRSQSGGGLMINQAIHTLDLMCLACGDFNEVKAFTGNFTHPYTEVEDTVSAHISFKNGSTGIFFGSISHRRDAPVELEVVCENAVLSIRNSALYINDKLRINDNTPVGSKEYYGSGHTAAVRHFYNAIVNGTDDFIHIEDTYTVQRLIDAINNAAPMARA